MIYCNCIHCKTSCAFPTPSCLNHPTLHPPFLSTFTSAFLYSSWNGCLPISGSAYMHVVVASCGLIHPGHVAGFSFFLPRATLHVERVVVQRYCYWAERWVVNLLPWRTDCVAPWLLLYLWTQNDKFQYLCYI